MASQPQRTPAPETEAHKPVTQATYRQPQAVKDALADAAQLRDFAFEAIAHCNGDNWTGVLCSDCAQFGLVPDPSEQRLLDAEFMAEVAALAFAACPGLSGDAA